jgi:alcohol dehydrogenase (cytochrome c)
LTALDKANGDLLWEFQTDAGIHAAPSTFKHAGQQYVVALSAGSFFPGTKRGDSVWLFSLDGGTAPSDASASAAGSAADALTH